MQVLITGSREASSAMRVKAEEVVRWALDQGHSIIVGDAPGVDRFVRIACSTAKVPVVVYGAYGTIRDPELGKHWEVREKIHGTYPNRDLVMASKCDMCVGIWNGTSRGTKITFEAARRLGKRVIVRTFKGD